MRGGGKGAASRAVAGMSAVSAIAFVLAGCQPDGGDAKRPAAAEKITYEAVLKDDSAAIASGEASTRGELTSALVALEVVRLYAERARLTGSYDDYARAEALMARLNQAFPTSEPVCLAQARLDYSLHRLAKAKARLDGCPSLAGKLDDLLMRADIAFYTGRYKDAGTIYRAVVNQVGGPQAYIQLGLYAAKTGSPGEALAYFEAAEQRYHGASAMTRSWLALQRGIVELERGRYDEARALFALADERLPGYWLNEEHLGEVAELTGDTAGARRIYEAVIKKTGAPEYLDAMGGIEAEAGNTAAAQQLYARAEAVYTERAKRFPEAIAGHALDHYLDAAPQPAKALELAEANYGNRPHGDAAVALAKAYLLNKRPRDAIRLLDRELAMGWDTAETWWTLSVAAAAAGDSAKAKSAQQEALRRNPSSAKQYG